MEATAVKEPLDTEAAHVVQLRREVEILSDELMNTKEELELLKIDMERKLQALNTMSPANHEVSHQNYYTYYQCDLTLFPCKDLIWASDHMI